MSIEYFNQLPPWALGPGNPASSPPLLESGTGVNGDYQRFADGRQVCIHVVSVPGNDNAAGGGFVTPAASRVTWTYPAAFLSGSTVHLCWDIRAGVVAAILNDVPGVTSATGIGMWGLVTSSTARNVTVRAEGWWK